MTDTDSSQFYTGLVAELYEPLAGDLASAEPIKRFVTKYGTPALELACGGGHPMLALLADGLEVHGIDSSQDMLDLCLRKAAAQNIDEPTVVRQRMQELSLPHRYACCYLAGASFCLMENIDDARAALSAVHEHLHPGGAFLVSLFRPEIVPQPSPAKERTADDGATIAVQLIAQQEHKDSQTIATTLRYTRERKEKELEVVDRVWRTRWYTVAEMHGLLGATGFEIHRCTTYEGAPVEDHATNFTVIALRA
ncbi:MAG: class I SAM-dependent methyltransferase [Pseudomonadota bacterium]